MEFVMIYREDIPVKHGKSGYCLQLSIKGGNAMKYKKVSFKWSVIAMILLSVFLFGGCSASSTAKQGALTEKQKTVQAEVRAVFESLIDAAVQKDYERLINLTEKHYADDTIMRYSDPRIANGMVATIPMNQYKSMLRKMPGFLFDYTHRFDDMRIVVAADCQSAKISVVQVETYTMDREAVAQMVPYLLTGKRAKNIGSRVTFEMGKKITAEMEYRKGSWIYTLADTKVTKSTLI